MTPIRKKLLALGITTLALFSPTYANAQNDDLPLERLIWITRVQVPQTVADYQTLKQFTLWCLYEMEQNDTVQAPCEKANELRAKLDKEDSVQQMKAAIRALNQEPTTPTNEEHMRILEDGLDQIMAALQPIP